VYGPQCEDVGNMWKQSSTASPKSDQTINVYKITYLLTHSLTYSMVQDIL